MAEQENKQTNQTKDAAAPATKKQAVELTAKQAAAAVKRQVPVLDDKKKPTGKTKDVAVDESEVLSWAKRGDRVIVVTTDGQKLEGTL